MTDTDATSAAALATDLVDHAHVVVRRSGRRPWRDFLRWISRGRAGRPQGWPDFRILIEFGWQDTVASERHDWRCRAAVVEGETVFRVDYRVCRRCRLGWVEGPNTDEPYLRKGLAAAGLAALRAEHPRLSWHTLGAHFTQSRPFWSAVAADIPGGYQQRQLCAHTDRG